MNWWKWTLCGALAAVLSLAAAGCEADADLDDEQAHVERDTVIVSDEPDDPKDLDEARVYQRTKVIREDEGADADVDVDID
jgi:hypothetical protein